MSESRKTVLEANGVSGRVCVEFEFANGRFSHTIWLVGDNQRTAILKSVDDPADLQLPCFTELNFQDKNLFLTGANGQCNWSMSVEVGDARFRGPQELPDAEKFAFSQRYGLNAPSLNVAEPAFQFLYFDVACRLKEEVPRLGTVYLRADATEHPMKFAANSGQLQQTLGSAKAELLFGSNPEPDLLQFDPDPQCILTREPGDLVQFSTAQRIEEFPATIQWSYGFWRAV